MQAIPPDQKAPCDSDTDDAGQGVLKRIQFDNINV